MATLAPAAVSRPISADNRFFVIASIVMALVVVAGFSTQLALGRSSFHAPALVHAHAVLFMGWVAIYVLQNVSAAQHAMRLHRTLGWVAAGWAAAMVVLGIAVTVAMVRRGTAPFFFQPAYFLVMNPMSVLVFAALTAAALIKRRNTAWHRRLHYCGMAILLGPALGRLLPMPLLIPYAAYGVFAAVLLFPLAGILADRRRTGRVHPAWWWGIGSIVAMQIAIDVIAYGPAGQAIYRTLVAGTPGEMRAPLDFPPPPGPPLIAAR